MLRICIDCGRTFEGDPAALRCPDCAKKLKSTTLAPRMCRMCGEGFIGGPRASYCPDCRAERRKKADREHAARARAGKARKLGSEDVCAVCRKKYMVCGSNQRYCPECAAEVVREKDRAAARKWYREHVSPPDRKARRNAAAAEIPCVICGKPFVPSAPAKTCSVECAAELRRRTQAKNEKSEKTRAYRRERRKNEN